MKYFSALAFLLFSAAAFGTCPKIPSTDVCLEWTASTHWVNGTPIAAGTVITYTVWRATADPNVFVNLGQTTTLQRIVRNEPRGVQCYRITATVTGVSSAFSSAACKTVRFGGPTEGTIERPTDGGIEPRNR